MFFTNLQLSTTSMHNSDIIVIGAGATGLMAAHQLAGKGKTVTVLEARNRTGGRIHTLTNELFFTHAELGAEFIHGDLPVTLSLVKEAGLDYTTGSGEMWHYRGGRLEAYDEMIPDWDKLISKLEALEQDMSIQDFLEQHFGGSENEQLRKWALRYVAGYDTADPKLASAKALGKEWGNEDDGAQHRITDGYCVMIKYLCEKVKAAGSNIVLNAVATDIRWKEGAVTVTTADGEIYHAAKLIVAMPLGVLQAKDGEKGTIAFHPPLPGYKNALCKLGFGAIIKVLLEFDSPFWEDDAITQMAGAPLHGMQFLFTEEVIPTWWTQSPNRSPLFTGWLGGQAAFDKKDLPAEDLLKLALTSLSHVFKIAPEILKDKLIAWNIANWTAHPYTRGSYAYDTVGGTEAKALVSQPVQNTIYFAGEYLYEGTAIGTVEAALTSGRDAAARIV